ncbi:hypothetical protein KAT84_01415 [Candidatus Bipolaricaulota bacterium]|nr:hypothetical protein [Candidatus Bipolaricaulota bacterium]
MRSDTVFSTSSLQAYLTLVFLCGIALALSIQPASRIAALRASNISYLPGLFHLAFVFLFGLFAVNRGAVVAANASARISHLKLILRFLEHIVYGLLLLLPYLLFSRALLSDRIIGLFILASYTAVSSLFFCLVSYRLELRGNRRKRNAFLLRYGFYGAFCLVPFGIGMSHRSLSLLLGASPIGLATRIIGEASAIELLIGFLVPILGILWLLTRRRRFDRRHYAV